MNVQIVSNENWPQLEAAASSTVLLIPEIFYFFLQITNKTISLC
jgi:hypothetical protein